VVGPLDLPPRTIPNLNTFRVLNLVWRRRSISRIEVAQELGLTKGTVTKITGPLLATGLLVEGPEARPDAARAEARGRPRVALGLNPHRGLVLGLEVRTDGWSSVLLGLDGTVVLRRHGEGNWNPGTLATDLAVLLSDLVAPGPYPPVVGVGVALPGIVDPEEGVLLSSHPLGLSQPLALRESLEARLGLPVHVENDARCGCWGELAFGAPVGPFVFVLCEQRRHRVGDEGRVAAVGFGLVLSGRPWRGPDASAGEFSSALKDHGGSYQFQLDDPTMARVFSDPSAEAQLVDELGRNLALIVNFLNLKAVYVAWPETGNPEAARRTFARLIEDHRPYQAPPCPVLAPTGGTEAVAYGAAASFLEDLWGALDSPRWK